MTIEKQLLLNLLQKYESSQAFRNDQKQNRRIMLRLYDGQFKPYDFEDYEAKIMVHSIVQDLKKQSLVDFSWVKGEEGHIIDRVWLNLDQVDAAYAKTKRISPKLEAQEILGKAKDLEALLGEHARKEDPLVAWMLDLLSDMMKTLNRRQKLASPLPRDFKTASYLMQSLRHWFFCHDQGELNLPERVFSLQVFADSKLFEQHARSRMASWVRQYLLPHLYDEDSKIGSEMNLSDDEAMTLLGLIRAPEVFELSGPLALSRNKQHLAPDFFATCLTISATELDGISMQIPDAVNHLLFIENRTNFHWLAQRRPAKTLLVYHGGCFSPAKARLFSLLKTAVKNNSSIKVSHWGDLDLGGFLIFNRLKNEFFPHLEPWHMETDDLLAALNQAQPIDDAYVRKLQEKLKDEGFSHFHAVIEVLIEKRIRLEQEALLGVTV